MAGHLSREEMDRLVRDAKKYKEEDDRQRERLAANNSLESCVFNMMTTLEDKKLREKISAKDKQMVLDKCSQVLDWIGANEVRTAFNENLHANRSIPVLQLISLEDLLM